MNPRHYRVIIMALLSILGSGCTPHPLKTWWPKSSPLAIDLPVYMPPVDPPDNSYFSEAAFQEPHITLTLRDALSLALTRNPDLSSFAWEVRVAEARALQASLPPNPEIRVEIEDFGGSGAMSGIDGAQSTISIGQVFLLGEKIKKRVQIASLERDLASWNYQAKRIEVLVEITKRFIDVLAAQHQVQFSEDALKLALLVHDAVTKRIDAGDASPIEATRTHVLLAMSRIEVQRTQQSLHTARYRLAALWGNTTPQFETATGTLEDISSIPTFESFRYLVNQNPQIARWAVETARRQAMVKLADAETIPNIEVGLGWRHFNETDDTAFVAELSLPLPLFDRNQGGVQETRYALMKIDQQRQAVESRVRTILAVTYQELASTHAETITLRDEVLPAARASFEAIQAAFEQGGGSYLDIIDAQRTLANIQGQYIDALARFHRTVADVECLIGLPLTEIKEVNPDKSAHEDDGINP